jgi:uroporphyrinogen decarboxylase
METWNKKKRFEAVMNNKVSDRPLVSAWRHFTEFEHSGPRVLADVLLYFQKTYDWDFIKVNPRAVYYHEAWGNEYDYSIYNDVVPTRIKTLVEDTSDLGKIKQISGREGVFAEQIEMIKMILDGVKNEVPVMQSVFTPIGILLNLCGMRSLGRYRESSREGSPVIRMIQENGNEVHRALDAIARTIADYCDGLVEAGVDGVFYAALGMARSGYFTREEWEEFVKPYDLIVLESLKTVKTIVHTCGIYSNPEWFVDYPVNCIHWAESATGNTTLAGSAAWIKDKVPMGGVDERLFGQNKAQEISKLAKESIKKMSGRPYILAPDCSVSTKTLDNELKALRKAVEEE